MEKDARQVAFLWNADASREKKIWKRIETIHFESIKKCSKNYNNVSCCKRSRKRLREILKNERFFPLSEAGDACIDFKYYDPLVGNRQLLDVYYVLKFLLYDKGAGMTDKLINKFKLKKKCGCESCEDAKNMGIRKELLFSLDEKIIDMVRRGKISEEFTQEEVESLMPGYASYYPGASGLGRISKLIRKTKDKVFSKTEIEYEEQLSKRMEKGRSSLFYGLSVFGILAIPLIFLPYFKKKKLSS